MAQTVRPTHKHTHTHTDITTYRLNWPRGRLSENGTDTPFFYGIKCVQKLHSSQTHKLENVLAQFLLAFRGIFYLVGEKAKESTVPLPVLLNFFF